MSFQAPLYELKDYLDWTRSGKIQLPDFQRGYKWEDERIRSLLVTVLRGHPLGIVMLLETGSDQVRFQPKPLEGSGAPAEKEPELLLLDGQQRLTSLTQALTGDGIVATKDDRGKLLDRKYFVDIDLALHGDEHIDDAVRSLPGDGVLRTNFNRDIVLDVSTREKEIEHRLFPLSLLFSDDVIDWFFQFGDQEVVRDFNAKVIQPAKTYNIPAIKLEKDTSKSAVATVFEKVNTGGMPLNVFELLTATFAGDKDYYDREGEDFRLNDDWAETEKILAEHDVLRGVQSTEFLKAVLLLATRKRNLAWTGADSTKAPGVTSKNEDVLKLTLEEYLEWRDPLREAFVWAATFLADRRIYLSRDVPYSNHLVPLAAIKVVLGSDTDPHANSERLIRWFWSGILGEKYGGSSDTVFARDVMQVPPWVSGVEDAQLPWTVNEANFVESRLHSLRTRNAAAYKGIYALMLGRDPIDWIENKHFDRVQYADLAVDIHHIFPQKWCNDHAIDDEHRESIVNKTALAATTNRSIGGDAPSKYIERIKERAGIDDARVNELFEGHLVSPEAMRADDFDAFFAVRREALCELIEAALGKPVLRDIEVGEAEEASDQFDADELAGDVVAEVA